MTGRKLPDDVVPYRQALRLSKQEAEVTRLLVRRSPDVVSSRDIDIMMTTLPLDGGERVRVVVSNVRYKLKRFGATVCALSGGGYWIRRHDADAILSAVYPSQS